MSIRTHYVCAKGNDHWLSAVSHWSGVQKYDDDCRVRITIEGNTVHVVVLPDKSRRVPDRPLNWKPVNAIAGPQTITPRGIR